MKTRRKRKRAEREPVSLGPDDTGSHCYAKLEGGPFFYEANATGVPASVHSFHLRIIPVVLVFFSFTSKMDGPSESFIFSWCPVCCCCSLSPAPASDNELSFARVNRSEHLDTPSNLQWKQRIGRKGESIILRGCGVKKKRDVDGFCCVIGMDR